MKTILEVIKQAVLYLNEHGVLAKLAVMYNGGTRQVAIILDVKPKDVGL